MKKQYNGGFAMISYKVSRNEVISAHARAVYLCLRSYGLLSYPSYRVIMKQTGIRSRTTILKAITDLRIMGFLEVHKTGIRMTQYYLFPVERDYYDRKDALCKRSKRPQRVTKPVQEMDTNKNDSIKLCTENEGSLEHHKIQEGISEIMKEFVTQNNKKPE